MLENPNACALVCDEVLRRMLRVQPAVLATAATRTAFDSRGVLRRACASAARVSASLFKLMRHDSDRHNADVSLRREECDRDPNFRSDKPRTDPLRLNHRLEAKRTTTERRSVKQTMRVRAGPSD
jgi:hypothetical protein